MGECVMQVTAILYANPGWSPSDGGKLRLWPPPMIDQAATGPASLHSGHPPPGALAWLATQLLWQTLCTPLMF